MPFKDPPPLPPELRERPPEPEGDRYRSKPGQAQSNVTIQKLAQVSVLGTNFAFAVAGGAVIGWLLDRWLGTEPWLLLSLAIAGLCTGLYRFFKEAGSMVSGAKPGPQQTPPREPPPGDR